jgi:c-di-GMP-related signal transduction protein
LVFRTYAQCFLNFLDKAQVSEACLEVKTSDRALKEMLLEEVKENNIRIKADSYIDTTQDVELARKAGLSYYRGYESQSPKVRYSTSASPNYLT